MSIIYRPDYWQLVANFWIPTHAPAAQQIAEAFRELSDPDMGFNDDISWSVAVGNIVSDHSKGAMRNFAYAKPGDIIVPRFPITVLQRPKDQKIMIRHFRPETRLTVSQICMIEGIEGQVWFETSVDGSKPFLTPLDCEFFPVARS